MIRPQPNIPEYISLLTQNQAAIFAFLRTLLINPVDAEDVLQETNIALWNNISRFEIGTNFYAFATRIAYTKAIDHTRRQKKLGGLVFDSDLMERLSKHMLENQAHAADSARQRALETCITRLPPTDLDLIQRRYFQKQTIRDLVFDTGKTETNLQYHFGRIRNLLKTCIESKLSKEMA
ncbi:MAG: sigma-70 family RNA polymerase sigma factor [Gloeobacteraceae cyanobacterium ES-bin-144]|nr:sigma-70 family RNA polymerase sigma factor [Verrucomicrobiales bacterium]